VRRARPCPGESKLIFEICNDEIILRLRSTSDAARPAWGWVRQVFGDSEKVLGQQFSSDIRAIFP